MHETCGFHKAATWYEKKPEGMLEENNEYQESMSRSLFIHYILESSFARIFLILEPTLQQETHIYTNLHNLHTLFLLFLSSFDNNFILIGHSKQMRAEPKNSWRSKNRTIRPKFDSQGLSGKGKLLFMGSSEYKLLWDFNHSVRSNG